MGFFWTQDDFFGLCNQSALAAYERPKLTDIGVLDKDYRQKNEMES
jgi:hypothetical protein